jgi:hypothetical protein
VPVRQWKKIQELLRTHGVNRRALSRQPVIPSELRNGASEMSDMDGNAARVAPRESGDEQVQSPSVSEISRDVSSLCPTVTGLQLGRRLRSISLGFHSEMTSQDGLESS